MLMFRYHDFDKADKAITMYDIVNGFSFLKINHAFIKNQFLSSNMN